MSAYYDSKIQYIESTGTQYIDTEIVASQYIGTSITVEFTQESYDNSEYTLMGVGDANRTRWGLMYYLNTNSESESIRGSQLCTSTNSYYQKSQASRGKHKILYNYNFGLSFNVDGEVIQSTMARSSGSTYAYNIVLFGRNNNGSIIEKIKARIYSCKITSNDEIVRDFIPVRVGKVGYLYDRVSGQLFGNLGSGTFTLGPDLYMPGSYSSDYIKNFRRRLMLSASIEYDTYLTFKAITDCEFTFFSIYNRGTSLYYSINNGQWIQASRTTRVQYDSGGTYQYTEYTYKFQPIKAGSFIQFKGELSRVSPNSNDAKGIFGSSGQFEAWGDPWSLYFPENFRDSTFESTQHFNGLFYQCDKLISAEHMQLKTPVLLDYTYSGMFEGCTSLTKAPQIEANTVGTYSCYRMFAGCTNLINVPDLKITTFNGTYSCAYMFLNCTSLTKAPTLPAITFTSSGKYCYNYLFSGCTSLSYIKSLNTTVPTTTYTTNWVNNVAASGIFVKNINATWTSTGTYGVPSGWTILYFNPTTEKYYLSDKTTECDEYGNVI